MGGHKPKSDEARLKIQQRRDRVRDALLLEKSIFEIAKAEDVSPKLIRDDAAWMMKQHREDMLGRTENLVLQELTKYQHDEGVLRAQWMSEKGKADIDTWLRIFDRIMKVMERRTKLLGLDATEEIRLDVTQVNQLVTRLVHVVVNIVTDKDQIVAIVGGVDDLLSQFGAGDCLPRPESQESEPSPEASSKDSKPG